MSDRSRLETTLGHEAILTGGIWVLDLSDLPILHGLSVLSRALAEMIIAQARSDRIDIDVERKIRPRENPELLEVLGVTGVKVCAEHRTVMADDHPGALEHYLRALLGNLQRKSYREALLPPDGGPSRALVADFPRSGVGIALRFVMEFVTSARDPRRGFLRITIEKSNGRRLDLATVPHLQIEDFESRTFIAGTTRIAQTWAEGLRRAAGRGRRSYVDRRQPFSHLFRQLDKAGLGFENVAIHWGNETMTLLLEEEPAITEHALKRVLLALEDRELRSLLTKGEVLRVDSNEASVHLDVSQLGRILHLSLGERRERSDVEGFLERMPVLRAAIENHPDAPLTGTSVFLIHHITAEVLGLIGALRRLGCRDLVCVFVVYGGEPPTDYLDAILDLPADEFQALALVNVPTENSVEGHYRLSTRYSDHSHSAAIDQVLAKTGSDFFGAMRTVAVSSFIPHVERARAKSRRMLLIEDGGYLAPLLNRAVLDADTVGEFLAREGHTATDDRPLHELLSGTLVGTVEHTRNGHDRLEVLQNERGSLAFPAFSIAISRLKREVESREVAISVLNAVENVLHAEGHILSRRQCLVLGSRGIIGTQTMRELSQRLEDADQQLAGIDLAVEGPRAREAGCFADLPEAVRLSVDLVVGVTGASVLQPADLEAWLAAADGRTLFLASGSTKTIEFADLAHWIDGLLQSERPTVAGDPVQIGSREVVDPRTGRLFGQRVSITRNQGGRRICNQVVFLANLTPVNFLFYGVAREVIDEVLTQLLTTSLGMTRRTEAGELEPVLRSVDREISHLGESISPSQVP